LYVYVLTRTKKHDIKKHKKVNKKFKTQNKKKHLKNKKNIKTGFLTFIENIKNVFYIYGTRLYQQSTSSSAIS